jgi:hypothetical protein
MAMLALKALSLGSEKIPDKAFHAVPGGYFRPEGEDNPLKPKRSRLQKEKETDGMHDNDSDNADYHFKGGQRSDRRRLLRRQRDKNDNYSASESDIDEGDGSRRPPRPSRRNRRYQSSQDLDRGYDSDGMTRDQYQQSRGMPHLSQPPSEQYFPPPPIHAYEGSPNYNLESNIQFTGNNAEGARDGLSRGPRYSQQVSAIA